MNMGIVTNYFDRKVRSNPLNLAVARILISILVILKLVRYEWGVIPKWPVPYDGRFWAFQPPILVDQAPLIAFITGVGLFGFLLGYRYRLSAFISALGLTYLGIIRFTYNISHGSDILWIESLIILFFGVYSERDVLSVDELRRTGQMTLSRLTKHLESDDSNRYSHPQLVWSLLLVGVIYFQAGFQKLRRSPLQWIQPENLGRYIVYRQEMLDLSLPLGDLLLLSPVLLSFGAIMTILLEAGLLPAILLKKRVDMIILGLIGMHVIVAFSVGPVFTDWVMLLFIFFAWDRIHKILQRQTSLEIVYDEHCFFCARSLYLFEFLDLNGTITFYSQYTAPDRLRGRDDVNFEDAMYAFQDGNSFEGYQAFQRLFNQFGTLRPIYWFMTLPLISAIGEKTYRYIAENRSRHFTCAIDPDTVEQ